MRTLDFIIDSAQNGVQGESYEDPSACKEWCKFQPATNFMRLFMSEVGGSGDQRESSFTNLVVIFQDHLSTWPKEQ